MLSRVSWYFFCDVGDDDGVDDDGDGDTDYDVDDNDDDG